MKITITLGLPAWYGGRRSCDGKIRFREASAQRAAARMAKKQGCPFDAYHCQHCDGWHIGHAYQETTS